jgi:hypothetical protein
VGFELNLTWVGQSRESRLGYLLTPVEKGGKGGMGYLKLFFFSSEMWSEKKEDRAGHKTTQYATPRQPSHTPHDLGKKEKQGILFF